MTTSSQAVHRRVRRRRQLAFFLTLAVIITVIVLAVRYRSEQRETSDYLALVDEIAQEEFLVAQSLRELFDALGSLDRPAIVDRMASLGTQTSTLEAQLGTAVVTRRAAEAHGFITVAVRSWRDGLDALDEAVVDVMDQPDDSVVPPDSFTLAVNQLLVGDVAYDSFLNSLPAIETDLPQPDYPTVAFIGGDDPVDVFGIASRLRLRPSFAERQDITVTANTVPEPTGDRNDVRVLPFTGSFDVTAIVTNAGNVVSEEIEVTLRLTVGGTAGGDPFQEQRLVAALDPSDSVSLQFRDIAIEPGTLYTLQIVAEIVEDADIDNNVWEVMFATNSE